MRGGGGSHLGAQPFIGRDHHPSVLTMLLAGGGIRGWQTYGATDDISYYITENPVSVRDLQATVLHLLGLDPPGSHPPARAKHPNPPARRYNWWFSSP